MPIKSIRNLFKRNKTISENTTETKPRIKIIDRIKKAFQSKHDKEVEEYFEKYKNDKMINSIERRAKKVPKKYNIMYEEEPLVGQPQTEYLVEQQKKKEEQAKRDREQVKKDMELFKSITVIPKREIVDNSKTMVKMDDMSKSMVKIDDMSKTMGKTMDRSKTRKKGGRKNSRKNKSKKSKRLI
jgi:hypothetical protein